MAFLARHRNRIAGFGITALAVGLLLSAQERSDVLGRSVGLVGAPFQTLTHGVAEGIGSIATHYVFLAGARQEADRLRREAADLRRDLVAVQEVALENQRLKALLNLRGVTDLPMLPARVVGRSASGWFRTVVLDKGSEDGVRTDSPVVTAEGVVGRVYQVGATASRVLLVTDSSSAVDGLIQRTRSPVVVEGRLTDRCRILYLARADDARPGDRVVTSGLDQVFPKGLLVGEISRVEPVFGGAFQAAELKPTADVSRLEEVFVVVQDGAE